MYKCFGRVGRCLKSCARICCPDKCLKSCEEKSRKFSVPVLATLSLILNVSTMSSFWLRYIGESKSNNDLPWMYTIAIYISNLVLPGLFVYFVSSKKGCCCKDQTEFAVAFLSINIFLHVIWFIFFNRDVQILTSSKVYIGFDIYGIIALSMVVGVLLLGWAYLGLYTIPYNFDQSLQSHPFTNSDPNRALTTASEAQPIADKEGLNLYGRKSPSATNL